MSIRDTLISPEYAADIRARYDAFEAWRAGRATIHPSDVPEGVPQVSNEERGKLEQFEVWHDKPANLVAYASGDKYGRCTVSVWTGLPLGHGGWGPEYRSNMGDKRRSVSVTIAGERYAGTAYVSAGDYCRLKRCKART